MRLSRRAPLAVASLIALSVSLSTSGPLRAADDTKAAPAAPKAGHLGKAVATADLTLDPQAMNLAGMMKLMTGYMPSSTTFAAEKPVGIKKEPVYLGTPHYAVIPVGNGPNRDTIVVVDDKEDGSGRLYVDTNRNGDLTDDGDSAWAKETKKDGNTYYGITDRILRASWADPKNPSVETSSGPYSLGFYYTVGGSILSYFREAARVGTLAMDGKQIPIMLMENDSDGIFDRSAAPAPVSGTPAAARPRPISLYLNESLTQPSLSDVKKQRLSIGGPFRMNGQVYEARISPDGSKLTLYKSDAKIPEEPKLPPAPSLLTVGKMAPDFTVSLPGGGTTTLAALKGKVVILDFWATWCGPCQHAMPHLEGVYQQIKNRSDATVLAVCVSDDRSAFDKWVGANIGTKYNFPVAFDLAARDSAKSISRNKYGVSGIPTQFIIDKDGRIAASHVGYGDGDHSLEESLNKIGIAVTPPAEPVQTASAK